MIEGEVSGPGARPIHTIDSAYAKEMRKHEANYTEYGPPGRPYQFRAYPTMMYKADRRDGTGPIVVVTGYRPCRHHGAHLDVLHKPSGTLGQYIPQHMRARPVEGHEHAPTNVPLKYLCPDHGG